MKWIINKGKPPRLDQIKQRDECPNLKNHLYGPHDYMTWPSWTEGMTKRGYVQSKCPGCGFWMIWTKKQKASA